jgi:hypothetical protein
MYHIAAIQQGEFTGQSAATIERHQVDGEGQLAVKQINASPYHTLVYLQEV